MDDETLNKVLKKIDEFFKDPKNVKDFKKHMKKESNKPCYTHLQCNIIWCKYNKPKNPDMGTITWCSKYTNGQEELCNEQCGKREWYELHIGGDDNV